MSITAPAGHLAAALVIAAALSLAACGGGVVVGTGGFVDIGLVIDGRELPDRLGPGQTVTVVAQAGEPVEFDANEPVGWTLSLNGGPALGVNTTVQQGGLAVTLVALSPSRVVLQSTLTGPAVLPAVLRLVATSTRDAAQVVVVQLELR